MNTAMRKPAERALNDRPTGLSQDSEGVIAWSPAVPAYTCHSATIENRKRIASSAASSTYCVRADNSMPRQAMSVIPRIQATPSSTTQPSLASMPNREYVYRAATSARFAMTMTSAAISAQPLSQPARGPNTLDVQVKLVPQSGVSALRDLYA